MVFEVVPRATARIESVGVLRSDIRIVEYLLVGCYGRSTFGRANHMALITAASRILATILDTVRNLRIDLIRVVTTRATDIHRVTWRSYP